MRMECPQCGVSGTLDDAFIGRKIRCPKCNHLFQAGGQPAAGPQPEPQASAAIEDNAQKGDVDQPTVESDNGAAAAATAEVVATPPPIVEEAEEASTAAEFTAPGDHQSQAPRPPAADPAHRFVVGDLLRSAWELTSGVKGVIWGGFAVMYGVSLAIMAIITLITMASGSNANSILINILNIINSVLSMILTAGLLYMGVLRGTGRKLVWKDVFAGFPLSGQIVIASILQMLVVTIGFFLLVLPGIYLLVGYMMTLPLMIDQGMTPWQAMEASRRAIHKVWWQVFGLYLVMLLVIGISAIPFGIGLIWTAPMSVVLCGVVYAALFSGDAGK